MNVFINKIYELVVDRLVLGREAQPISSPLSHGAAKASDESSAVNGAQAEQSRPDSLPLHLTHALTPPSSDAIHRALKSIFAYQGGRDLIDGLEAYIACSHQINHRRAMLFSFESPQRHTFQTSFAADWSERVTFLTSMLRSSEHNLNILLNYGSTAQIASFARRVVPMLAHDDAQRAFFLANEVLTAINTNFSQEQTEQDPVLYIYPQPAGHWSSKTCISMTHAFPLWHFITSDLTEHASSSTTTRDTLLDYYDQVLTALDEGRTYLIGWCGSTGHRSALLADEMAKLTHRRSSLYKQAITAPTRIDPQKSGDSMPHACAHPKRASRYSSEPVAHAPPSAERPMTLDIENQV